MVEHVLGGLQAGGREGGPGPQARSAAGRDSLGPYRRCGGQQPRLGQGKGLIWLIVLDDLWLNQYTLTTSGIPLS